MKIHSDQYGLLQLFPPITPYRTGYLPVSDLHTLYYEESGNPQGQPVVFLHGGPGGGTVPLYRQFFDPEAYRIILFDQRGCGKSTPHAELTDNSTWELVADIEKLRHHLGIERWGVFGGSWGSTLALAYAIHHPEPVTFMILRGIFLCRQFEIQWFYQEGTSLLYPDEWEKYLAPIPTTEHHDLVSAYYQRLTSTDEATRLEAALAWSGWEAATSRLLPDPNLMGRFEDPHLALPFARIECHYFINRIFMPSDDYLLNQIDKIRHIPGSIIQGRYDVVCPPKTAWDLHKAWPEAQFHLVQDAGHSAMEPGICHQLLVATEQYKQKA